MLLRRLAKHPEISWAAQSRLEPANIQVRTNEKAKKIWKQTKNPQQDTLFTLGHAFKHLSFKKKKQPQMVFGKRLLCGFLITTTQTFLQLLTLQVPTSTVHWIQRFQLLLFKKVRFTELVRLKGISGDSPVQTACWKQGQLGEAAQGFVHLGFKYNFQGWKFKLKIQVFHWKFSLKKSHYICCTALVAFCISSSIQTQSFTDHLTNISVWTY